MEGRARSGPACTEIQCMIVSRFVSFLKSLFLGSISSHSSQDDFLSFGRSLSLAFKGYNYPAYFFLGLGKEDHFLLLAFN